jgi:hypothetical protein
MADIGAVSHRRISAAVIQILALKAGAQRMHPDQGNQWIVAA